MKGSISQNRLRRDLLKAALAISACAGMANPAFADQKSDLHVLRIFTEGTTTGGFYTVENITADCLWGLMYIDLSSPAGRGQLALLMQAKAQNLSLIRVDYTKNANGTCTATGIHVQ